MHNINVAKSRHLAGGLIALGFVGVLASPSWAETTTTRPTTATTMSTALTPGPYVGIGGALNIVPDMDFQGPGINGSVEHDIGWGVIPTIGYRFRNGLRGEIEGAYRRNNIDSSAVTGGSDGFTRSWSAMANLLYDFSFGWPVHPYIGAGIGAANVDTKGGFDAKWGLAYQGIAGMTYKLANPLELFIDYRYFSTANLNLKSDTALGAIKNDDEYRNHTVLAGLRWTFGSVPAVIPAAAPTRAEPAPIARNYTVFFDFDRADLTAQGRSVVETAVANAKRGQVVMIDATGYTDRSGPASYNMDLSRRRAMSVKNEMVRMGIPENQIEVAWRGENDNLVPTADGVREPQNRRVTIVYR